MISSQPAAGKSVLAIQAAYQISQGYPLFGVLEVTKPVRVWYIQMERSDKESLERIQLIRGDSETPLPNLFIDVELQALNFLNPTHFAYVLKRGEAIQPGLIIIDPLYGIATGLSKDEIGSNVAKMMTVLKKKLNCALWINHHTVKNLHDIIDGKKVAKEDPFYGAQWLKAHVTASYLAVQGETGISLYRKKDSHGVLLKEINLSFDHETYLSSMEASNLTVWDRYRLYLNTLFRSGKKTYYFSDVMLALRCTPNTIREIHRTPQFTSAVKCTKANGKKTLYEIFREI